MKNLGYCPAYCACDESDNLYPSSFSDTTFHDALNHSCSLKNSIHFTPVI